MRHIPGGCLLWIILFTIGWTSTARSNVWPIEDTWVAVGSTTLSDITGTYDNGDGTNETMLLVNGTTAATGQGVTYLFRGVLSSGESLSVISKLVNPNGVECRLKVDFYNVTDSRVIIASADIVLASNSTQSVTLNMTAASNDANDILQLRFLRTDDGATTRDFAIDSVLLSDWYFPRTSKNSRTPDLPLLANDAALQTDMDSIINAWYAAKLPNPSASAASSAVTTYNGKNIVNTGGVLTGNITAFTQMSYLETLAGALYYDDPGNTTWSNAVNNTVKVVAQNLMRGIIAVDGNMYALEEFTRDAILLKNSLDQAAKDSLTYVLYRHTGNFRDYWKASYPGPVSDDSINTDEVYNLSDTFLIYGIGMQRNNQEAQRWARGLKRYCERFATPSRGTSNGIKVDGSGFHHWSNYENYMYAYNTFITVLDALDTTQLQIEPAYYYNFRDAVIGQFARTRGDIRAISLSGRKPLSPEVTVSQTSLKTFALVGGQILGLSTADPEVAKVYNYLYGTDPAFGVSGTNSMEGAFPFSYSHLGIYRRSNWTATMRGFSSYMWGAELYATENRYGRYQSYGNLQVIYSGGKDANGISFTGWDWNHPPGATTIVLPFTLLHGEKARIDEHQQKSFAGFGTLGNKGSELLKRGHGTYGVFGMNFQELANQGFSTVYGTNTHNSTFVFRKSAFTFDNLIIALGSNISNNDATYPTATTLYQHTAAGTVVVNGTNYSSLATNTFTTGSSRWVLDRLNTGYYVPSTNDNLVLSRALQSTPPHTLITPADTGSYQSGTFSKLYINHGTAPSNDSYEYVVIPGTTSAAMSNFVASMTGPAASRPYQVMAKDTNHHVVKYQGGGKEVWGMALFGNVASLPAESVVESNVGSSLVMYEQNTLMQITLSVTDPNLGLASRSYAPSVPSTVQLTLRGQWVLQGVNTNVTVQFNSGSNRTLLTFDLLDGMPEEVLLDSPHNNAPTFNSDPVVEPNNATEGLVYSGTIADNASDVDGDPLTFAKFSGPSWLVVATNGALSGIPGPGDVGTNNSWVVQVSDGFDTNSATLNIVVNPAVGEPFYPESRATDSSYEWIANVTIGSLNRSSGNDGGYYDATSFSTTKAKDSSVPFSLTKSTPIGEAYRYYWRIWIDLNHDGDFVDVQEMVYSSDVASSNSVSGSFVLPDIYPYTGPTRMRVSMKWNEEGYPTPNEIFEYGEVEDYTINIQVTSDGDLDDDGLPDAWELAYFGNETNAIASVDSDGDGQNNGEEFIAGFDPTNSVSFFSITSFTIPEGYSNAILGWVSVDGRMYDALWTNSLTETFSTTVSNMLYPQNSCTVDVNQAEADGFYKLEVRLLP